MGDVVVDVMLKSEILDPQGQAIAVALPRLGFHQFSDVRQGKRFVLTVPGEVTDEVLAAVRQAAETMLSNPVIEDVVSVRVGQPHAEPLEEPLVGHSRAEQSRAEQSQVEQSRAEKLRAEKLQA